MNLASIWVSGIPAAPVLTWEKWKMPTDPKLRLLSKRVGQPVGLMLCHIQ